MAHPCTPPRPILKRGPSISAAPLVAPDDPSALLSIDHTVLASVVRFSPAKSLSQTFETHSSDAYDRSPIVVTPNKCALVTDKSPGRTYHLEDDCPSPTRGRMPRRSNVNYTLIPTVEEENSDEEDEEYHSGTSLLPLFQASLSSLTSDLSSSDDSDSVRSLQEQFAGVNICGPTTSRKPSQVSIASTTRLGQTSSSLVNDVFTAIPRRRPSLVRASAFTPPRVHSRTYPTVPIPVHPSVPGNYDFSQKDIRQGRPLLSRRNATQDIRPVNPEVPNMFPSGGHKLSPRAKMSTRAKEAEASKDHTYLTDEGCIGGF